MAPERVKRDYYSPVRQAQVELSRHRVLTAANELFLTKGYAATSIAAIASRADVARETVYKLFSSKARLLKRLYDVTLAGDPDEIPIERRDEWQHMLAADPDTLIATFARGNAEMSARLAPMLVMITAGAAAGDTDLRDLTATTDAERLSGVQAMVDALARKQALRKGLDPGEAADMAWALISPEMWQLLTERRGWDSARYQAWLERSLRDSLLA